jgi:hypothetical protein
MDTVTDTLDVTKNRARVAVMPNGRQMLIVYDPAYGRWALMYRHERKDEDLYEPVPLLDHGEVVWLTTNEALDTLMSESKRKKSEHRAAFAKVLWEIRTSDPLEGE